MVRISFSAVAIGFLLTIALDAATGFGLLVLRGGELFSRGSSDQQMSAALDALTESTGFMFVSMLLGTLTTVVGGFVTARVAKRYPYFNGLAFGVLGILFGLLFTPQGPLWINVIGFAAVIPAALVGSHFAARQGWPGPDRQG